MQVELSKEEIRVIQKCLLSVEYANVALKLGKSKKLMQLFDKLENIQLDNK